MAGIMAGSYRSYGAYYEGEQQNAYYNNQALLTEREKEEARRKIEMDERKAEFLQMQAGYAQIDVKDAKAKSEIFLNQYQGETDKGVATGFTKGAKSGVDMSFGSPLEALADQSDKRAFGYAVTKWEGDTDVWQKERDAQGIQEKATIMLDKTKVDTANLGMYDYQASIYRTAAGEARKVARLKEQTSNMQSTNDGFMRGMSFVMG
jgi:hypothetical protein